MNVDIINSNISQFSLGKTKINLYKCIGSGSYGYIFLTDYNYVVKVLIEESQEKTSQDLMDFLEPDVINKIISKDFAINCNEYALGIIGENEKIETKCLQLNINSPTCVIKKKSYVEKKNRRKSFYIYRKNFIIIMPHYLSFYDYLSVFSTKRLFRNECVMCLIMNRLIVSVEELLSIGLINIDLKMNNVMIDNTDEIRIVDFGLTVSKERMTEYIDNDIKYYIWPKNKMTYSQVISYMLSMFILEIIYERKVYEFQRDDNKIFKNIIENFSEISWLSKQFKKILVKSLTDGLDYPKYRASMEEVFSKYNLANYGLPNMYYLGMLLSGQEIYPQLRISD